MRQNLAGLKIRALRKQAGLTQSELARRAGISPSYLNLIECNKRAIAGRAGRPHRGGPRGRALRRSTARPSAASSRASRRSPPIRRSQRSSGHPGPAEELVGRNPGWAGLVLRLHRAWLDQSQAVLALADRLNRDPFLGDSVHRMLTNVTSIRSAAEILEADDALERRRAAALSVDRRRRRAEAVRQLPSRCSNSSTARICACDRPPRPSMSMPSSSPPTIIFPNSRRWHPAFCKPALPAKRRKRRRRGCWPAKAASA